MLNKWTDNVGGDTGTGLYTRIVQVTKCQAWLNEFNRYKTESTNSYWQDIDADRDRGAAAEGMCVASCGQQGMGHRTS